MEKNFSPAFAQMPANNDEPQTSKGPRTESPAPLEPVFRGLLSATVTPMKPDGTVDVDAIDAYGAALKHDGVAGVFCCGTTGESMSLTVAERKAVTQRWVSTGLLVCAQIGAQSLYDVMELARHAQDCGAHGIAIMQPAVFKPNTPQDLVRFLSHVSKAAPRIPLLVYHFPAMTGTAFALADVLRVAIESGCLPNLRGAKFTDLDMADFSACINLGSPVTDVMCSREENVFAGALLGGQAFVGRDFSFLGPLFNPLVAAARQGDLETAKRLQYWNAEFRVRWRQAIGTTLERGVAATKVLVGMRLRRDMGEMRCPGPQFSGAEVQKIRDMAHTFAADLKRATGIELGW